ncbi:MAG: RNA polymerase sigma factor [Bacteroidales bacterium]|nr:RNA polymerase sigma factor [Bacteroidales bacterium]
MDNNKIISLLQQPSTFKEGYDMLVKSYTSALYWNIRRLLVVHEDTQDVLQNVWVKVYLNLPDRKGNAESLKAWLYKIANNESINWLKKKRASRWDSIDDVNEQLLASFTEEIACSEEEMEARFQKALIALPHKQKIVFNLRYYDELSYQQISEITGQSVNTLKTNYHYAVESIKNKLGIKNE